MRTTKEFQELKFFLETHPLNKIQLSTYLGYTTTTAIDKWIQRKNIPRGKAMAVMTYIKRKSNDLFR